MAKSFVKRKAASGDVALQITSMADIFMILLVFLLKNYAASTTSIAPTTQLSLPEVGKSKASIKETLKVEIANDTVLVDQKPVARLHNFEFDATENSPTGVSPAVMKILSEQRKNLSDDPKEPASLLVMADQKTPYSTIKRVVASAAGAGFVDLQLVVVETE